jgi:transposase
LASVETNFAVDSSGFSKSRFARYFSYKHGRDLKYKSWIKVHLACGVKTNVVTAVILSDEERNDYSYFIPLLEKTGQGFNVKEVMADKAYSGRGNHDFVASIGGTAYIPFKKNAVSNSKGSQAWKKMYQLFLYKNEEFMEHYHKRSNCETVFHMIKSKFKDNVRSKGLIAQRNEILLKVLCHNICVLIQEMNELGIAVDLTKKSHDLLV